MNPWVCALLIIAAGAMGGAVNALLTDGGIVKPRFKRGIWCPGFISNLLIGAFSAFSSWAFYGSGAGVDISQAAERTQISLRFSALAGAFLVGVAGSKWITNEVEKRLFKESIKVAGSKQLTSEECDKLVQGSALQVLERVESA
jgi:hypothetical protein